MEANRKRAKVHMLPTNDKSLVFASLLHEGALAFDVSLPHASGWAGYQHLYITTDEEIKEGDWHLHFYEGKGIIGQSFGDGVSVANESSYRKIIASTDLKLTNPCKCGEPGICHTKEEDRPENCFDKMPQPTQAFIKAYCEQGGIDEVDVEYSWQDCQDRTTLPLEKANIKGQSLRPKVDPIHNTITTHLIEKKMYNREEVIDLIEKTYDLAYENCQYDYSVTVTARKVNLDKWIEENL